VKTNYFIKLSYLGTRYCGWQIQKNVSNTLQQVIQETLSTGLSEEIFVQGCGRTDTGVHAREFYLSFESKHKGLHKDPRAWLFKFNRMLPHDIAFQEIFEVTEKANARFSARARTYEYYIIRNKDPFMIDRAWHVFGELDLEKMKAAAAILPEYSDFKSFSKTRTTSTNYKCTIKEIAWEERGDLWVFRITADRFLRNMVRAIVGTLVKAGKGQIEPEEMHRIIKANDRSEAGKSVPAGGLYLTKVIYPKEIFINE
jgi:tRNA pseudouridine38-40 synthase